MHRETEFRKRCGWMSDAASWTAGLLLAAIAFDILWQAVLKHVLGLGGGDWSGTGRAVGKEIVASLGAICLVGALSALGRLFGRMERGAILVADNAQALVRAGEWVVAAAVAEVLAAPILGGVLGLGDGPHIDFSWSALALGLFGGALILLGDVLRTAARAQTELDGIV